MDEDTFTVATPVDACADAAWSSGDKAQEIIQIICKRKEGADEVSALCVWLNNALHACIVPVKLIEAVTEEVGYHVV